MPPRSLSHLHLAVPNLHEAADFFRRVLELEVSDMPGGIHFTLGSVLVAVHEDWGQGATAMTLALVSEDCEGDHARMVAAGAHSRMAPEDRGAHRNASVYGPGNLVIELEQRL